MLSAAAFVTLAGSPALAHVGPSPQANNRYLTLVPEPGAVRLVYTLIFGDSPGAAARTRMDRDGDGVLSPQEQRAFADSIAEVVAAGLEIELDGEPVDLAWNRVDVAIGTTAANAGAFSIDLSALLCFEPKHAYSVRLTDSFRVSPVGEGALSIEARDVKLVRSAMGDGHGMRRAFKWMGPGRIASEGYVLEVRVPEGAQTSADCLEPEFEPDGVGDGVAAKDRDAAGDGAGRGGEIDARATEPAGGDRDGPGRYALAAAALVVVFAVLFALGAFRRRR